MTEPCFQQLPISEMQMSDSKAFTITELFIPCNIHSNKQLKLE